MPVIATSPCHFDRREKSFSPRIIPPQAIVIASNLSSVALAKEEAKQSQFTFPPN
jgi:hypothetical protein